jgi:hypothetical protein
MAGYSSTGHKHRSAYPAKWFNQFVNWPRGSLVRENLDTLRRDFRASILDVNDGITTAAGMAEAFISAGAATKTLLLAGTAIILAGGSALAGARYSEVRTEWEVNHALSRG